MNKLTAVIVAALIFVIAFFLVNEITKSMQDAHFCGINDYGYDYSHLGSCYRPSGFKGIEHCQIYRPSPFFWDETIYLNC